MTSENFKDFIEWLESEKRGLVKIRALGKMVYDNQPRVIIELKFIEDIIQAAKEFYERE